jgi:hypothetical protein
MLNTHMDHLDWCEAVQEELKKLRADLDKVKCKHKHWGMVADTSGVHTGYHCLDCGFNLNTEQSAPREFVTRKGEAYWNGFSDGVRAVKGGA